MCRGRRNVLAEKNKNPGKELKDSEDVGWGAYRMRQSGAF